MTDTTRSADVDIACAKQFDQLLDESTDIEPRLRSLWLVIYKNAMNDRAQADALLVNMLCALTNNDAEKHSLHGPQAVKYLERVSRANDQLLKLAEQVRMYRDDEGGMDSDEILNVIDADKDDKPKGRRGKGA